MPPFPIPSQTPSERRNQKGLGPINEHTVSRLKDTFAQGFQSWLALHLLSLRCWTDQVASSLVFARDVTFGWEVGTGAFEIPLRGINKETSEYPDVLVSILKSTLLRELIEIRLRPPRCCHRGSIAWQGMFTSTTLLIGMQALEKSPNSPLLLILCRTVFNCMAHLLK